MKNIIIKLSFNTASGKYCCNFLYHFLFRSIIIVSIPQAVSTVATVVRKNGVIADVVVSIPQAVSTVATTIEGVDIYENIYGGFNTASGKYCCNHGKILALKMSQYLSFNTASGKYCCNLLTMPKEVIFMAKSFNTASGKYCCNSGVWEASIYVVPNASFGKSQTVNGKFSSH